MKGTIRILLAIIALVTTFTGTYFTFRGAWRQSAIAWNITAALLWPTVCLRE